MKEEEAKAVRERKQKEEARRKERAEAKKRQAQEEEEAAKDAKRSLREATLADDSLWATRAGFECATCVNGTKTCAWFKETPTADLGKGKGHTMTSCRGCQQKRGGCALATAAPSKNTRPGPATRRAIKGASTTPATDDRPSASAVTTPTSRTVVVEIPESEPGPHKKRKRSTVEAWNPFDNTVDVDAPASDDPAPIVAALNSFTASTQEQTRAIRAQADAVQRQTAALEAVASSIRTQTTAVREGSSAVIDMMNCFREVIRDEARQRRDEVTRRQENWGGREIWEMHRTGQLLTRVATRTVGASRSSSPGGEHAGPGNERSSSGSNSGSAAVYEEEDGKGAAADDGADMVREDEAGVAEDKVKDVEMEGVETEVGAGPVDEGQGPSGDGNKGEVGGLEKEPGPGTGE